MAAPHHDHPRGSIDECGVGGEESDRACAGDRNGVPGPDVAAPRHVQGDAGRVREGAHVEAHVIGQPEDGLDVVHGVGGVDPLRVVSVLGVEIRLAVVLTQVVLALDALLADAAGAVTRARDPVTDPPTEGARALTEGDDVTRPFVARGEGELGRPEPGVVTVDQMGVRAADRDGADSGQDLVATGLGHRNLGDLEHIGLAHHQGLHHLRHRRSCESSTFIDNRG